MAKGQTRTITTIKEKNNKADVTIVAKAVELIVVNDMLMPDHRENEPGVNSKDRGNI